MRRVSLFDGVTSEVGRASEERAFAVLVERGWSCVWAHDFASVDIFASSPCGRRIGVEVKTRRGGLFVWRACCISEKLRARARVFDFIVAVVDRLTGEVRFFPELDEWLRGAKLDVDAVCGPSRVEERNVSFKF